MNTYQRHRFPLDIISYEVWLYFRFNLNHRDIEDLLAQRELTLDTIHDTSQYANNRAELSQVYNLFDPGRHLVRARHYRKLRIAAFGRWTIAVA